MIFKVFKTYPEEIMRQLPLDNEFCCDSFKELHSKGIVEHTIGEDLKCSVTIQGIEIKYCPFCKEEIKTEFTTIPIELKYYNITERDKSVRKLIKTIYRYDCTEEEVNNIIKMINK